MGQTTETIMGRKKKMYVVSCTVSRLRGVFCLKLTYGIKYGNRSGGAVVRARVRVRLGS